MRADPGGGEYVMRKDFPPWLQANPIAMSSPSHHFGAGSIDARQQILGPKEGLKRQPFQ